MRKHLVYCRRTNQVWNSMLSFQSQKHCKICTIFDKRMEWMRFCAKPRCQCVLLLTKDRKHLHDVRVPEASSSQCPAWVPPDHPPPPSTSTLQSPPPPSWWRSRAELVKKQSWSSPQEADWWINEGVKGSRPVWTLLGDLSHTLWPLFCSLLVQEFVV